MTPFPERAYFQVFSTKEFGWVFRELVFDEAGDIEKAAASVDDDTVSFCLIELGVITDASEDVAAKWMELFEDEIQTDDYGELLLYDFVKNYAPDLVADLEGRIAVERLNNHHHNEHQFARAS